MRHDSITLWIMVYIFIAVLLLEHPLLLTIFSVIYWMIFGILGMEKHMDLDEEDPETKEVYRILLPNGKSIHIPNGVKRSIVIMLNYYSPKEVCEWCMRTYKWKKADVEVIVKQIHQEIKN